MSGETREPCDEFVDIGPFRFECDGHLPGARDWARRVHGGKLAHHSTSAGDVGDVNVTFWTDESAGGER